MPRHRGGVGGQPPVPVPPAPCRVPGKAALPHRGPFVLARAASLQRDRGSERLWRNNARSRRVSSDCVPAAAPAPAPPGIHSGLFLNPRPGPQRSTWPVTPGQCPPGWGVRLAPLLGTAVPSATAGEPRCTAGTSPSPCGTPIAAPHAEGCEGLLGSSEPCPGLPAAHRAAGRRKHPCSSGRPRFLPSFLPALLRSELTRSRHPRAPRGAAGPSAAPAAAAPTGVLPRATRKPRPQRHTSPAQDAPYPRPQPSCSPTMCPKPNTLTAIVAPARQGAWPWTPGSDRGRRSLGAHPTGSLAASPPGCRAAHPPCAGGSALGSSPRDNTQTPLPTSGISSQLLAPPRSRHTAASPSAAAPLSEGGRDAAPCHGRMSPSPARTTPRPTLPAGRCWGSLVTAAGWPQWVLAGGPSRAPAWP